MLMWNAVDIHFIRNSSFAPPMHGVLRISGRHKQVMRIAVTNTNT